MLCLYEKMRHFCRAVHALSILSCESPQVSGETMFFSGFSRCSDIRVCLHYQLGLALRLVRVNRGMGVMCVSVCVRVYICVYVYGRV